MTKMHSMTRRTFLAGASSVAVTSAVPAQESAALTGYSPGNVLSKIDGLELLNLWGERPKPVQDLYSLIDSVLSADKNATYADVGQDEAVRQFCRDQGVSHLGGPMLGCVTETSARVWVRTARPAAVEVRVMNGGSKVIHGPVRSTEDSDRLMPAE